jgi:hypothetical protein
VKRSGLLVLSLSLAAAAVAFASSLQPAYADWLSFSDVPFHNITSEQPPVSRYSGTANVASFYIQLS